MLINNNETERSSHENLIILNVCICLKNMNIFYHYFKF